MLKYFLKCKRSSLLYAIVAPLNAIMNIGLAWAMATAIDYALGGKLEHISFYIIAFSAYICLDLIIFQLFKHVRYSLLGELMLHLRTDCYGHIMRQSWGRFQKESTANYLTNLTTDMEILRDSYFSMLLDLYIDGLQFIIAGIILFIISPLLGIFVLIMALLQMLIPVVFSKKLSDVGNALSATQGTLMKTLKENLSSFFTIITFRIEKETGRIM